MLIPRRVVVLTVDGEPYKQHCYDRGACLIHHVVDFAGLIDHRLMYTQTCNECRANREKSLQTWPSEHGCTLNVLLRCQGHGLSSQLLIQASLSSTAYSDPNPRVAAQVISAERG